MERCLKFACAQGHAVQLLQNLIGNAIKYRGFGVPEVRNQRDGNGWRNVVVRC